MLSLASLVFCFQLLSRQAKAQGSLVILDTGVGHRSTPIPRWATSLRSTSRQGTNATTLVEFGPEVNAPTWGEPIHAYSLAWSPSKSFLFSATSQGVKRTNTDGSDAQTILEDLDHWKTNQILCLAVADKEGKLYFGTREDGLIKKANFDGTRIEVVRNVSRSLKYHADSTNPYYSATFYPSGIAIDENRGLLYWSASQDGSIRRTFLNDTSDDRFQILVDGLSDPKQIRAQRDSLYWNDGNIWEESAIKYLDYPVDRVPAIPTVNNTEPISLKLPVGTLIHANQNSSIFKVNDGLDNLNLGITSYVMYSDGITATLWFVAESSGRKVFSKLVEVVWRGSGGSRGPVFKVLNENATEIGVPKGLEYVR